MIAIVREWHREARELLAKGIDPCAAKWERKKAEKKAQQDATQPTFAQVAEEWLETWGSGKSARYVQTVRFRLDGDILRALGEKPIREIGATDVVDMVKGIPVTSSICS